MKTTARLTLTDEAGVLCSDLTIELYEITIDNVLKENSGPDSLYITEFQPNGDITIVLNGRRLDTLDFPNGSQIIAVKAGEPLRSYPPYPRLPWLPDNLR